MLDEFDPLEPRERVAIGAVGVALLVLGLLLGMTLLPMRQALAASLAVFLLGILLHFHWRYRPLNEASRLISEGRFPAAQYVLQQYLSKPFHRGGRANLKARLLYAHSLWYLGEVDQAIEVCDQMLVDCSDHGLQVLLLTLQVSCYMRKRMTLKVHATMGRLAKLDGLTPSESLESRVALGICAMNEEMFHEAIEILAGASKDATEAARKAYIFGMLSACYNRVKDYIKALGAVQDGKKLQPTDALTRSLLLDNFAFAKANLKQDLEEALAAADEGIGLGVEAALPHLYTSRGEVHYARRDFDRAMSDLEESLRRLPERDKNARQKAWFIKGKIHKARGEDELAHQALSQAISIDSSKTIAMNAQAVLASPEAMNTLIQTGDVKLS